LARTDLVVLHDLGSGQLTDEHRRDPLELLKDRYALRSTLVTSQFPVDRWHEPIGNPPPPTPFWIAWVVPMRWWAPVGAANQCHWIRAGRLGARFRRVAFSAHWIRSTLSVLAGLRSFANENF
jgi:hypothetical protein